MTVTLTAHWILFLTPCQSTGWCGGSGDHGVCVCVLCVGDGVEAGGGGFAGDEEGGSEPTECCCVLQMSWRFILRVQALLAAVLIPPIVYRQHIPTLHRNHTSLHWEMKQPASLMAEQSGNF